MGPHTHAHGTSTDILPFGRRANHLFDAAKTPEEILLIATAMIHEGLGRKDDAAIRAETLKQARAYLGMNSAGPRPQIDLEEARSFGKGLIAIIARSRGKRGALPISKAEIDAFFHSYDPEVTQPRFRRRAEYSIILPPPTPHCCADFDSLLSAALCYRVESVLTFFHRWNPRVQHLSPIPFLLSECFSERLTTVIKALIAPAMSQSRQVLAISGREKWTDIDTASFWDVVDRIGCREALTNAWQAAWERFRPQPAAEGDDNRKSKPTAGPELRALRGLLTSKLYVMPEIRDREINLFISLISPELERDGLEAIWVKLRQIYQQEMEPQKHQAEAREGALRDALIDSLSGNPGTAFEFIPMLVYWNFPQITDDYLKQFIKNLGSSHAQRLKRVPYLCLYVDQLGRKQHGANPKLQQRASG